MPTVLITGANRGIGRALAGEFARRGHRVVATARDPHTLEDLDVGRRLALDVTDDASVAAAVAEAGDVDVVVANAGRIFYAAVEATPLPELQRLFNLNTVGAIRVAQAFLPQMRSRGTGKLVFMSSVLGRVVPPPSAAYSSTKWALEALIEALAIEVAPFGVQAALLEPAAVSSGALDDVTTYTLPGDPYAALLAGGGPRDGIITPAQVAAEVVDAVEKPQLPLRIPIGDAARALLAARRAAPDDVPFVAAGAET
ncbi:SDR family NAD(P)-dependent oxidoreductase [Mycobacterium parmense]|uniref:Short-chain dehydrogenase/reductase n=1 Tax=Mycobacterium parmense TaxID=185642 RepID=A0A7I7YYE9_9MYCO|nr:SDR family NAD(P)-dependent oxidoreductase [Mycobacterium parmense]MCV7352896.1 SDR family NAD(P)-dependent oxidoreductase [Mycobacterium parmense]ORW55484.1 3-oxoacyl-ACP reductase [Mycobacterium parmense]BBZ46908.1 short-chain dehydrogenase/reductase [Mycobacterium parmense]